MFDKSDFVCPCTHCTHVYTYLHRNVGNLECFFVCLLVYICLHIRTYMRTVFMLLSAGSVYSKPCMQGPPVYEDHCRQCIGPLRDTNAPLDADHLSTEAVLFAPSVVFMNRSLCMYMCLVEFWVLAEVVDHVEVLFPNRIVLFANVSVNS